MWISMAQLLATESELADLVFWPEIAAPVRLRQVVSQADHEPPRIVGATLAEQVAGD